MAGLQAVGLKNNNTAYLRSQATFLAYELADRMRANNAIGNGFYGTVTGEEANPNNDCTSAPCTALQMAQNDIYQWGQSVQQSLPMGKGTVARSGDIHTITIGWDDNRDGAVTPADECDPTDSTKDPCFKLSVQP
jgi:type IV pilus assembly protein PilV